MGAANALAVGRGMVMLVAAAAAAAADAGGGATEGGGKTVAVLQEAEDIPFGTPWWYVDAGVSCLLVLFAGIMSGLTLGLMSLGLVDLEILQRSGTLTEKKQAAKIIPVVQKQHQLLVTLLLCNAASMEALPIYLDKIFHPFVAVVLSVTFVLAFGEVIPQAICSRYGLAVGANFVWLVCILMVICYPISYPIGKVFFSLSMAIPALIATAIHERYILCSCVGLIFFPIKFSFQILDCALGHNESALFRRAQLKALVSIHSLEAGKGGELTHDETTIISGALDLTEKTAEAAMTPIESTFSLEVNSKLDWEAIGKILARGHSRVPVYSGSPRNIIGLLLVKSLLSVRAETETPVSSVSIRRIPRVPADMPLYDILNEFQKGSSHMAAVVKAKGRSESLLPAKGEKSEEENEESSGISELKVPLLSKEGENSDSVIVDVDKQYQKQANGDKPALQQNDAAATVVTRLAEDVEEGEVIGIITLEDVFEELLQEEIVDETDEYVDVHKRIRVAAAAAAAFSVARTPSVRRLTGHKAVVSRHLGSGHEERSLHPIADETPPLPPSRLLMDMVRLNAVATFIGIVGLTIAVGVLVVLLILHQIEIGDEDEKSESSDSESNDDLELSKVTEMRLLPSYAGKCSFLFLQMTTPISIEDVRREVKILKALSNHNNLVKFYDACEDALNVYVVMELCEGGELLERILSRGGRYSEEDAKAIVIQILSVIVFCHLQGVVHRDLKQEEQLRALLQNATKSSVEFHLGDNVVVLLMPALLQNAIESMKESKFTNLKYSIVEIDEVRFEWAECMLDYI
ncbi:hypothetical protein ZIOFF_060292 [Zingiber officinale]|uniref:Protein kinase domain-containing protein n=1 Tax=Zingiber officinale TaxID=94328 RepID=A0A8J5FBC1_ZINOF|nr:hypothetical protein ZIOFF_060292 [Zingiber officinale]